MKRDVSWTPISKEGLNTEIERALAKMTEEMRRKFAAIRIPFLEFRCRRHELMGDETLYAIASKGRQYIIYDDVESDFGLVVLSPGESERTLRFWVLADGLPNAMRVLENGDYSACLVAP
ncbi:MAG: hypothetical protein LBF61_01450 [Azoarcus sp.]|jgi:hypothetical protein|nr:hypothetical protein [Azoarcus sp.]